MPHGHCYLWKPSLVSLHLVSDTLLFISFEIILIIFLIITYKSKEKMPFSWTFLALSGLFLLCGFTHIIEVWYLWHTNYWLGVILKALTAIASVASVIAIIPGIPNRLSLPTPTELLEVNKELNEALEEKEKLQQSLIAQEKITSLGILSAGIAHEVRNPINLMMHSALYVKEVIDEDVMIFKDKII